MSFETDNKVKIRIKLRSGEEFEAEGSPEFIEKQRADFLHLIGKEGGKVQKSRPLSAELQSSQAEAEAYPQASYPSTAPLSPAPAALRRTSYQPHHPMQQTAAPALFTHKDTGLSQQTDLNENQRLWEELCKTEDDLVILRRKSRLLAPETAAVLLIAAAKALLGASTGFGAISLSKALSRSGYGGNRLDRVLAGEIKRGTIKSFGSKRSRSYSLSDEGFARAFVLAGKVLEDWR